MKLLLDQNVSARLVSELEPLHPGSSHVREHGLERAEDQAIWDFAKEHGFASLSKDADFHQLSFLRGHPPKVIWVNLGNCTSEKILEVLKTRTEDVAAFAADEEASFLRLAGTPS